MGTVSAGGSDTITTQNLVPAGAATANSAVEIALGGMGALGVQVVGTFTGVLSLQVTLDGSTWVTCGGTVFVSAFSGVSTATIGSGTQGVFQVDVSGFTRARVTGLAAMTGSAVVTLSLSLTAGIVGIDTALPAGSASIGTVILGTGSAVVGSFAMPPAAGTAYSRYLLSSAASTNGNLILTGARKLMGGLLVNTTASLKYVKLYNKATAPTVGTDTPILTISIPPNASILLVDVLGIHGLTAPLGLGIAITGAFADADTTNVAAGDVLVCLLYL